ncbi:hypothetical protein GWK47_048467 [Chionoecetes opilio]|uniref:Transmembrane protein n=1 Tax=Chionoecetes opilio TaxID=41210 RepID=A0A8J4Y2X6_CHIOP|nr:hypothetical protein GWK47_048467 [Chionoecetes opilio]
MQLCSCFPYRIPATSDRPVFSLPLCLWNVFLQLLNIAISCEAFREMFVVNLSSDIGTAVYIYAINALAVVAFVASLVTGLRSSMLADMLHDLSVMKDISPPPRYRWYHNTKTIVSMLFMVISSICIGRDSLISMNLPMSWIILYAPFNFACYAMFMLPEELPAMVFGLLARRLLVATEATVVTVSGLLAPDGSFKRESDVTVATEAMRDLQAVIREVEVQREKGTRCFFPVTTLFLLVGVLLAITGPYALHRGNLPVLVNYVSLFIACYIMVRFSHMGQDFVNQVSRVRQVLRGRHSTKSHLGQTGRSLRSLPSSQTPSSLSLPTAVAAAVAAGMLPPDTASSLLPWRVLVTLMQLCSCFPYRIPATSDPPVFSLPLCLWNVFLQLLFIAWNINAFRELFTANLSSDIGTAVFIYAVAAMMVAMFVATMLTGLRSNMLADMLHDLSVMKDILPPSRYRWYHNTKTIVLLSFMVIFPLCYGMNHVTGLDYSIAWTIFFTPLSITSIAMLLLPEELPAMVFGLLARRLLVATEATVVTVSGLLVPDGSFKRESDVTAATEAMRDLQAVIREVEVQREKGTRCFFPVTTLFLLMGVVLAITGPYAIQKSKVEGWFTYVSLLIACYILVRFSHMGQDFVNQVGRVRQIKQVLWSLSPLLTFNMCGWYTLGYSSLLGLMNTVVTYVVIILQVGGQAVQTVPSSPDTGATAAPW